MTIQCLAIGTDVTNKKELDSAFQYLDDEFKISFSESVVDAISTGDFPHFDLIILDPSHDEASISTLSQFIVANGFRLPLILVDKSKADQERLIKETSLVVVTLQKPINPTDLSIKILSALRDRFYQGRMTGIDFISILQLIELDKLTSTLALSHPDYPNTGLIFFKNGNPIDAQFGGFQGEEAIEKIFSLGDVEIKMYEACPLVRDRLKTNCSKMIMDNEKFRPDTDDGAKIPATNQPPKSRKKKAQVTGLAGLFVKVKKDN